MNNIKKFTLKQEEAYNYMKAGYNVFVTGPAGVGKSAIIKCFILGESSNRRIALTSTTGASALIIGGTTLHSYLGIGLGTASVQDITKKIRSSKWYLKRWTDLDTLIIDEVSMLSPGLFDKIEHVARLLRGNSLPFGGIQLIASGDWLQLPCVNSDNFCFESESWKTCIDKTVCLNEIVRQTDKTFQECLNYLRLGIVNDEVVNALTPKIKNKLENELGIIPTKLYSKNVDVDLINDRQLDQLAKDGREFREYVMRIHVLTKDLKGDILMNTVEKFKKNCNAPEAIQVCQGAQVMLLKNLDIESGLVNGSRGVVKDFIEDCPLVVFLNGEERVISLETWDLEENGKVILSASQIPLRVAYAITIHKSQGCTLDYVEVDLDGCFEYGQAYVALSRAKSLDGLCIKRIRWEKIKAHPKALEYYNSLE